MAERESEPNESATFSTLAVAMWRSVSSLSQQVAELAALEARLAVRAVVAIVVMAVMMLLFVITGWLLLSGAAAVWLTQWHFSWGSALAIMAGFNLACVVLLLLTMRQLAKRLTFRHTRNALRITTESRNEHQGPSPLPGSADRQPQASA